MIRLLVKKGTEIECTKHMIKFSGTPPTQIMWDNARFLAPYGQEIKYYTLKCDDEDVEIFEYDGEEPKVI